jgi:antitoxin ParD1/3/4
MATVEKISIALPPDLVSLVKSAVASGDYASTSEVIRDALRDWKQKRQAIELEQEELRLLIHQGMASGPSMDAEEVFARLRQKYSAR